MDATCERCAHVQPGGPGCPGECSSYGYRHFKPISVPTPDAVNQPSHYNRPGLLETKLRIRLFLGNEEFKSFCKGNILKYVARFEFKGRPVEDLNKAKAYIDMLIDELEKNGS